MPQPKSRSAGGSDLQDSKFYYVKPGPLGSSEKAKEARARAALTILRTEAERYLAEISTDGSKLDALMRLEFSSLKKSALNDRIPERHLVHLVSLLREVLSPQQLSAFKSQILEKFANFSELMLFFSVNNEDLLSNALSIQFGLSASDIERIRPSLENLIQAKLDGSDERTLPDEPPKYAYAPRMEGGIVQYLRDNWASYIEAGLLARPDLKRIDRPAYTALNNWLRQNQLPPDLHIPTLEEANDKALGRTMVRGISAQEAARLSAAAARRASKNQEPQ